jgi:hypothetical protein
MLKQTLTIWLCCGILLLPAIVFAKPANEQDEVILLNDSAEAVAETDPALSKSLTQWASKKEKEWEYENANKNASPPPITAKDLPELRDEIKLLEKTVLLIKPVYPLIAQGLIKMEKEINAQMQIKT